MRRDTTSSLDAGISELTRSSPLLRDRYVDWLEAHLEPRSKVLELGSGTGRPVAERLAYGYDYLGVDASTEMVSVATGNVPNAQFLVADMRRLELPAGKFDAVVAFYSIIHVPRIGQPALFPRSIDGCALAATW